ncbi:MAG: hypothetical protein ACO1N5_13140 [Noviherbaspirillum sp.]
MHNPTNPLAPLLKMQLELSRQVAEALFSGMETASHAALALAQRSANEQLALARYGQAAEERAEKTARAAIPPQPATPMAYQQEALRLMSTMQSELAKSMAKGMEQGSRAMAANMRPAGTREPTQFDDLVRSPLENLAGIWAVFANNLKQANGEQTWMEKRWSHIPDRRVSRTRDRRSGSSRAHH